METIGRVGLLSAFARDRVFLEPSLMPRIPISAFSGSCGRRGAARMRLLLGLFLAAMALGGYFFGTESAHNEITGETQRVGLTVSEEIAMGLHAAPTMAQRHGGLHPDAEAAAIVKRIGERIVANTAAKNTGYKFEFHLLADSETVNAFALPGGQVSSRWAC